MKLKNEQLFERVNDTLNKLRPHFQIDGGNIEISEISEDNIVKLKWTGACAKCEKAELTMKYSVREYLMTEMPELKDVMEM